MVFSAIAVTADAGYLGMVVPALTAIAENTIPTIPRNPASAMIAIAESTIPRNTASAVTAIQNW